MDMKTYRKRLLGQAVLVEAARIAFERAGDPISEGHRKTERNTYIHALMMTYEESEAPVRQGLILSINLRALQEEARYIENLAKAHGESLARVRGTRGTP